MLNLFNSFRVPGVDDVEIFHDDTEDDLYWMLPEVPTIHRGEGNKPAFHLLAFARDFTLMADEATQLPPGELEGGLLSMTTQLVVSQEDQQKIRSHIQGGGGGPVPRFRDGLVRILLPQAITKPIRLAYPTYVDGSVEFGLLPGDAPTFVKGTAGSKKPTLSGSNLATYSALLGQEGVRLLRHSLEDGNRRAAATINYAVTFLARIPSVTIRVTGNMSDVYQEIKEHCTVHEWYSQNGAVSTWTYPQVSSLQELKTMTTSLKIEIDTVQDVSPEAAAAGDASKAIEAMALNVIQTQIMPRFFAPGLTPGLVTEKLGTDPLAHAPGKTGPAANNNQMYLKNFTQEMNGSIDVSFTARSTVKVNRYPNTDLMTLLTPDEFAASVSQADLSTPYFSLLDVPVRVTANFDTDPIAAIKVFLDYDQKDDKTGEVKKKTEEFLFDTNEDVFYFRTIMARDAENRPKDTYRYRSQIVYKATAKTEDIAEVETRDRNLLIGYDRLGCVQVKALLGAMPPGVVERTQVHFRYPGLSSPTAEADVFLTETVTEGAWFTYTGGNPSREYEYQVTYFMKDGQQLEMPVARSSNERLVVNAPFEDRLAVTFVSQGVFPPIANIVVSARYVDKDADYDVMEVHTLQAAGETWAWQVNLRDKTKRTFDYKVDVNFADGSSASQDWTPGEEGTVNVGQVTRELLQVEVVPTLLDLTKWKLVIVRLKYTDPANGLDISRDIQITATGVTPPDGLKWAVPIKDPARRAFTWSAQAFGVDGSKVDVPATETVDPLVLLQV